MHWIYLVYYKNGSKYGVKASMSDQYVSEGDQKRGYYNFLTIYSEFCG